MAMDALAQSLTWSAFAAMLFASAAFATPPSVTIQAPDPRPLDFFGSAIAASNDFVVTGYALRYPALKGRILSFDLEGAVPLLTGQFASDFYGDGFGLAIAMDGDSIVVGAPLRRNAAGSSDLMAGRVHLLRRSSQGSISQAAVVHGPSAVAELGASVGIDQGWVVVGAPGVQPAAAGPGARWGQVSFYATDGNTLTFAGSIQPSALPEVRNFGQSVAIAGEWAAASANLYRGDLPVAGIVNVVRRDGGNLWSKVDTLMSPLAFAGDRFGFALAMKGNLLAAGAPAPGHQSDDGRGALFLYRLIENEWLLEQAFVAPNEEFCEGFGRSVAIGESVIAIGAGASEPETGDASAVFVYRCVTGGEARTWVPAGVFTGLASEDFGAALAIADGRLAIGVPGAAGAAGQGEGAVLLVQLSFADLNGDGVVDGADLGILLGMWGPVQTATPADINGDGMVDGADLATLLGSWS